MGTYLKILAPLYRGYRPSTSIIHFISMRPLANEMKKPTKWQ